jgi:transposase
LEASHLGKDDGVHAVRKSPREDVDAPLQPGGEAEKEQAVRLVRKLRNELGTEHGTIGRVARQLGYGEESVRSWVRQADIDDGEKPGVTSEQAQRIKALEQENKELRRANEILRRASAYFAQAELDRPLW